MRRMLVVVFVGLLLTLALGPSHGTAHDATPVPRQPGDLGAAAREFNALSATQPGALDLQFRVAAFDTAAHAHAAIAKVGPGLKAQAGFADLKERPEPGIADEAVAFTGVATQHGTVFQIAILVVRDGTYDQAWTDAALSGDPLADLLGVAHRRFGQTATPRASANASPAAGAGLLGRLPMLADLPSAQFRLIDEHLENAAGTPTP